MINQNILQTKNINYLREASIINSYKGLRIGIFGGSFNPAHQGHLHIAIESIKKLQLNFIVWLVTPENPLKAGETPYLSVNARATMCKQLSKYYPKIKVLTIEDSFTLAYSYLTINKIKQLNNNNSLFWIMGEDNLINIHQFKQWQHILDNIDVCIFARKKSSFASLLQKSKIYYDNKQVGLFNNTNHLNNITKKISFYLIPRNPISSTIIRNDIAKNS